MPTRTILILTVALAAPGVQAEDRSEKAEPTPIPVKGGAARLSPKNSHINFVATHNVEPPDPNARHGGFSDFVGKAEISNGRLESIIINIKTGSVWTGDPKLTKHIKSPDFLDVRSHPKAKFKSTAVESGGTAGEFFIKGAFTLLGTTREITVPAKIVIGDAGLTLAGEFTIKRSDFGITFEQARVSDEVAITVVLGVPSGHP